ncbi:uncharacterized protein EI90DRAFT_232053 [Cantharellus anzutake]|uniref:uncharacterized protein n=1 Tax=Cantharellus anzutake TaxID=1750568 RepID=UPI001906B950|nr:uncharacterized protein EI90DRAFT_232053 [Cantharellus anzutake]KAF8316491.1 hypothetical protein EI90DRAFT_232053 [Cantharellus anzutake]
MRSFTLSFLSSAAFVTAGNVIYEGRIPLNYTPAQLDASAPPFTTVVKGSGNASHYSHLLGPKYHSTPLWGSYPEQSIAILIRNSSVFVPGGNVTNSQFGFRRTELIAQSQNRSAFEVGTTVFHVSIMADHKHKLNYKHEYQIVFVEPKDGTHVFAINLGTPFKIPSTTKPDPSAHHFKVLDHAGNIIFTTPMRKSHWHNFAIQVEWDAKTLAVFFSHNSEVLESVTCLVDNDSTSSGAAGQGDFHWGVLKLPLADPRDTPAQQSNVPHHGIQEGTTEGLVFSGVFIEDVVGGVSTSHNTTAPAV